MSSESKVEDHHHQTPSDQKLTISDLPPESFYVPLDDEQEWFNCNAMMQRKASLKLGFNRNLKNNSSFQQRSTVVNRTNRKQAAGKSSSVLALPKVQRNSNDGDRVNEKKINGGFLLRTRSDSGVKSVVRPYEPSSPRVSCTGRIGSKNVEGGGKRAGFFRAFGSLIRNGSRRSDREAAKDETARNGIVN